MGRHIYWTVMGLLALLGVGFVLSLGQDPYPRSLIKLNQFENGSQVVRQLNPILQDELQKQSVIFVGLEPEQAEQMEVLNQWMPELKGQDASQVVLWMDQSLQMDEFPEIPRVPAKDDFEGFVQGVQAALTEGRRVVVIAPTVYVSQSIESNLVSNFKQRTRLSVISVSMSDFPRRRDQEKVMKQKCSVEGVDQTGVGPFGCVIAQASRPHYARSFPSGSLLGLFQEVGPQDYLLLITREK